MRKYLILAFLSGVVAMPIISGLSKNPVSFRDKRDIRNQPSSTIQTLIFNAIFKAVLKTQERRMVDPGIDEDTGPFSYFSRPSYQMGLPGERYATQITPEGHLFTGSAELEFFAGQNLEAISKRIWTLYRGYLPCINYQFEKQGILYEVQAFQYWLAENFESIPVNFIRITARNPGESPKRAEFAVGFEFGGSDHRQPGMRKNIRFNPNWKYEMTHEYATRDQKIIYLWDKAPSRKWAEVGKAYHQPFKCTKRQKPVCLASYSIELGPGRSESFTFKMPFRPMSASDQSSITELKGADFEGYLEKMESFWDSILAPGMDIIVPENKVTFASKAYRVHNFMCQNIISENEIQHVVNRFQYNRFWLRDGFFFARMYDFWNFPETAEKVLRHFLKYQDEDGNFLSQPGQLDGFGQSLFAFGEHVRLTHDAAFACEVFPAVEKAVGWLQDKLDKDPFGLMPPTNAMDNEQIIGRYTGHNFWALMGLDGAVRVAHAAGEHEAAEGFQNFRDEYYDHFMAQLRKVSAKNNGIIPPGMDAPDGIDWGNLLAVYPGHLLDPFDPLVTATFKHYRENHMAEGIATYRNSMHHYLTERVAQTALIRGEQELAIKEFYAMLLHTGSCHEGFEFSVFPWSNRDYCMGVPGIQICNFTPHGWYAAVMNTLLRMMFIREQGRTLHLLSAISPEWVKPGDSFSVKRAVTCFGTVNLRAKAREGGINIEFEPSWKEPPEPVILHIPFFAKVKGITVNGSQVSPEGDAVKIPACKCEVNISWQVDPSIKYSYARAVADYKAEYKRRYQEKH